MGRGVRAKKDNELLDSAVVEICKMINDRLPIKTIAARIGVHKCTTYRVRSGDSFRAIGEKFLSDEALSNWK